MPALSEVEAEGKYKGLQVEMPVNAENSAFGTFSSSPTEIVFGQRGSELKPFKPQTASHR
jgi:hypothetical protein